MKTQQKITYMKYLLIGVISSLFVISCNKKTIEEAGVVTNHFVYNNESGYNLEIIKFYRGNADTLAIPNESSYQETEKIEPIAGYYFEGEDNIIHADSLKLIYDMDKVLMLYRDAGNNPFNIIGGATYLQTEDGDNEYRYTYTFTIEDYNLAQ